jgi:hypothetical protein
MEGHNIGQYLIAVARHGPDLRISALNVTQFLARNSARDQEGRLALDNRSLYASCGLLSVRVDDMSV